MGAVRWMEFMGNNLRYAARSLRRSPGFTLVAVLTLALGIGANIAAFTVVRAVLLNPLPFPHPEQLVRVFDDLRGSNSRDVGMSAPELWDLRDRSGVFQESRLLTMAPPDLPRLNEIALSPGVLLFAFFISILTGVIFGLAPALQTVRPNQAGNLREGSRGSGSSKRQIRILRILVSSEIALSLVLLIGAGLLLRSFRHLLEVRPGSNRTGL
jgi:hypothetical protein